MKDLLTIPNEQPVKHCAVVRLQTSTWGDDRGLHIKKSLTYLKRKSSGHNWLKEELSMIGADDVYKSIINIDECKDGIYVLTSCNESKDWETGIIDDYDLKLVPYTEPKST